MTVRLNKYLRDSGLCSRRKADEFIAKGFVSVDGEVVTDLGTKIDPLVNKVEISSDAEKETDSYRYILLYKPVDYITTKNEYEGKTVFDLVPNIENLTYSGRLDKDSEGLIILSNDGNFIYHVANPDNEKEKEYSVTVDHFISDADLAKMQNGMQIEGKQTKPAVCVRTSKRSYNITLKEGMNRQVRKMAGKVHCNILSLKRIRIGKLTAGKLKPGQWRNLSKEEVADLMRAD